MASKYLTSGEQVIRTKLNPEHPDRISVKLRGPDGGNRWEEMSLDEYQALMVSAPSTGPAPRV